MRCCIFGGSGFIGAWVTRLLAAQGREVVVIGRSPAPGRPIPAKAKYVTGTYADKAFLRRVLAGSDEVIDLVYSTHPQTSFADPLHDITDNLPPTVSLLQVAAEIAVKKLVLVSSGGTVYGLAGAIPVTEEHPTHPISPYGITKLAVEKYGLMFNHVYGLPVVIARPGNAYGEGQRPSTGQGFVAEAIARTLEDQVISLFGDKVLPPRKFDVPQNVLDSNKLVRATGWHPQIDFREGLERAWTAALRGRNAPTTPADGQT